MTETECSEECRARRPLGSDSHIRECPSYTSVTELFPRQPGETMVGRDEAERPVAIPDEVVSEAERDYRAYKMWRDGDDWNIIAERENYPDGTAAAASVKRYLRGGEAILNGIVRQEIIADHVARLMHYRRKLKDGIDAGKPASIMAALAIEDRWVKAFALDAPDAEDAGVHTVVVPSEEFVEQLRRAAAALPQADAG